MVKKILFLALLIFLPLAAHAAQFTASLNGEQIAAGQSFTLELSLSGASARNDPDLSVLQRDFTIIGEGQTSNTSIINGTVSSSTGWELSLIPKHQGTLVIPPVAIETDQGVLRTQSLNLDDVAGQATPAAQTSSSVNLTAAAAVADPYKSQPVRYTVTILARANVTDLPWKI